MIHHTITTTDEALAIDVAHDAESDTITLTGCPGYPVMFHRADLLAAMGHDQETWMSVIRARP